MTFNARRALLSCTFIMIAKATFLTFIAAAFIAVAFGDLQCSLPGQCVNSEQISSGVEDDKYACRQECKNNEDCNWFTFHTTLNVCVLYNTCLNITEANCDSCVTSERDCDVYQCNIQGSCQVRRDVKKLFPI